jgi:flagellar motor switch protein FliG
MIQPTGEERALLLLRSLPPEAAEAVLARMDSDRAQRLRSAMKDAAAAPPVPAPAMASVLHDFVVKTRAVKQSAPQSAVAVLAPPGDTPAPADQFEPSAAAQALLDTQTAQPPDADPAQTAQLMLERAREDRDPVAALAAMDPVLLAGALKEERVLTVVMALSSLPVAKIGDVLRRLTPEIRREAALRLGRAATVNPDLQRTVAQAVLKKSRELGADPAATDEDAQIRKLADLLRTLERTDRKEVLDTLTQRDPATAVKVKELLYVFEDILRIEDRSVQALLAEVEMKTLAIALKTAEDAIASKVMNNLSMRAKETLTEEMALLAKPPTAQVHQAQAEIVAVIQRLDGDGKLVMIEE